MASSSESSDSSTSRSKSYKSRKQKYSHRSRKRDNRSNRYWHSNSKDKDYSRRRSRSSSEERTRRSRSKEKNVSTSSSKYSFKSLDKYGSDKSILSNLEKDEFVPQEFKSKRRQQIDSEPTVVQINMPVVQTDNEPTSIFHCSISEDKNGRFDRWVKKLYIMRQKALNEMDHE